MSNVPLIGGQHGVVIGPEGGRYWAENGLIKHVKVDGDYKVLQVRDVLERLKGINDLYGRKSMDKGFHTADEVDRVQRFICEMTELVRKAREQGMPTDPSAVRDRVRRLPTSARISTKFNKF